MFKWLKKQDKTSLLTLVLLAAIVVLGVWLPRAEAEALPQEIVEWTESNVVKVIVGADSGGTAFFIDVDKLLTACHVVVNWNTVYIIKSDTRYKAEVKACDEGSDLALLKLTEDIPDSLPTVIGVQDPDPGAIVYGSGHPFGLPLVTVPGHFQRLSPFAGGQYMNTTHVMPGDSGGPLLVCIDGNVIVVGVRVSVLRLGKGANMVLFPNLGFHRGVVTINEFLGEYA